MFKKIGFAVLGLAIAAIIAGALIKTKLTQFDAMGENAANMKMPPTPVNVAYVQSLPWQPRISAVGSVMPIQGTVVSAEVEGTVKEIFFTPGAEVRAGDALIKLDTAIEEAQLHEAQVSAKWARIAFDRAKELSKTKNISAADMDTAETNASQAEARLKYIEALIAKKTIKAPYSGRLGISQITPGQFLSKGTPIISLQSLDPLYVHFSLPQNRIGVTKPDLAVTVESDAFPGENFSAKVSAINPDIDPATRSFKVQATVSNPEKKLVPGMFVSVNMLLDKQQTKLIVPATAVLYGPYGDSVYVLEKASKEGESASSDEVHNIKAQVVRLGSKIGDFIEVTEGLDVNTPVVSTGVFKLMPGMQVIVDNSLAPDFKLAPEPSNN